MKSLIGKLTNILIIFLICVMICPIILTGCASKNDLIVILHAGGEDDGLTYLNAQETFSKYYAMGYRYFEYDFQLSNDGRLIGTHSWDYLDVISLDISYQEFKELKLSNGFTPVNEEWLIDTICNYPDVRFVIDANMPSTEDDVLVLQRIEEVGKINNVDLSKNIIPEIFSVEMWDIAKVTTTFDKYFFSKYKVPYTFDYVLNTFDDSRIWGIALSTEVDDSFLNNLDKFKNAGKQVLFFTAETSDEVKKLKDYGATGVYVDNPSIIKNA